MAQANKTGKSISIEILDFLEWFSAETPNEYEKSGKSVKEPRLHSPRR